MADDTMQVVPVEVEAVKESKMDLPEVSQEHFTISNMVDDTVEVDDKAVAPAVPQPSPVDTLQASLSKSEERVLQLLSQLSEKDMMITTLQRSCGLMEKETTLSKRELEIAQREKESAVMRYAIVEKKVIDANLAKDSVEKKQKESQKEVEALNHKLKLMNTEKTRMCQIVDQKCADIRHYQREMEKLKMDISMWESTNKASTARLKQESEAKGAAEQKINELIAELETFRNAEKAQLKSDVDSERLQVLEKQAVEQQAALILYKHEATTKDQRISEAEKRLTQIMGELKQTKDTHSTIVTDHSNVKQENERLKSEIFELQNTLDKEVLKVAELQAKVNDLESIRAQLRIERDSNSTLTSQLTTLREELEESNTSRDQLTLREEELLKINQELTECMARLQNELSFHKSKAMALTLENESVNKEKHSFDTRYSDLQSELTRERSSRKEERETLEKELVTNKSLVASLEEKLNNALGDHEAMKSKHNQALKELNRELMLAQKRCFKLEQLSDSHSLKSDNASDSESGRNGGYNNGGVHESNSIAGHSRKASDSSLPGVSILEPSKQSLIDRIVRLQQANAKQTEKLDFLENHSATLVSELQKKAKLVHYYMMRDQSGALVSSKSDKHKADLAKYGGIMSAIYSGVKGSASSADMTLDLSLEINKKLQAVLEDTLLKNITLKENLDTLGLEVDKLTRRMAK